MMKLCVYGCGRKAQFFFKVRKKWCCSSHHNKCPANKAKNTPAWLPAAKLGARVAASMNQSRIPLQFAKGVKRTFDRRDLVRRGLKKNECARCKITEWMGAPIALQVHHINGDKWDQRLSNIELLCPNCHSQTDNYAAKKTNRLRKRQAG
jgi:hypothetical protein